MNQLDELTPNEKKKKVEVKFSNLTINICCYPKMENGDGLFVLLLVFHLNGID